MSPVAQVIPPLPGRAPLMVRLSMKLTTQVPVAVLAGFGTASGAPNRQRGLVPWRSPKPGVVGQAAVHWPLVHTPPVPQSVFVPQEQTPLQSASVVQTRPLFGFVPCTHRAGVTLPDGSVPQPPDAVVKESSEGSEPQQLHSVVLVVLLVVEDVVLLVVEDVVLLVVEDVVLLVVEDVVLLVVEDVVVVGAPVVDVVVERQGLCAQEIPAPRNVAPLCCEVHWAAVVCPHVGGFPGMQQAPLFGLGFA